MIVYEPLPMDVTLVVNMTERGRNGGKARAKNMSADQRRRAASKAAKAKWAKFYKLNPGKKRARRKK